MWDSSGRGLGLFLTAGVDHAPDVKRAGLRSPTPELRVAQELHREYRDR
ncbi:MAG: hypothetical protein QNK79_09175 [Synechococcus sp. ArSW.bin.68]